MLVPAGLNVWAAIMRTAPGSVCYPIRLKLPSMEYLPEKKWVNITYRTFYPGHPGQIGCDARESTRTMKVGTIETPMSELSLVVVESGTIFVCFQQLHSPFWLWFQDIAFLLSMFYASWELSSSSSVDQRIWDHELWHMWASRSPTHSILSSHLPVSDKQKRTCCHLEWEVLKTMSLSTSSCTPATS